MIQKRFFPEIMQNDAEWLNEHEWTKQSPTNLHVQRVEADLNSTDLFGNSDDDNLVAGEPFPLRYWHYDWHECECNSAVRQKESEEICRGQEDQGSLLIVTVLQTQIKFNPDHLHFDYLLFEGQSFAA